MADQAAEDKNHQDEQQLKQAEVGEMARFMNEYGRPVLLGVALAAAVYLGLTYYRHKQTRAEEDAAQMLQSGRPEQLKAVVAQFSKTSSGPVALLKLAREDYVAGQCEAAKAKYADFCVRYPEHMLRAAAELHQSECLEAMNRIAEAQQGFEAFLATHKDQVLAPLAIFGKARCLEAERKFDEAKAVYDDFIVAHPDSAWNRAAETAIKALAQKKRAVAAGEVHITLPPTAPAAISATPVVVAPAPSPAAPAVVRTPKK